MAEKKTGLAVIPTKMQLISNEYSDRLKDQMFKESIKVDPLTCVYRHWASTRYSVEGIPTAHLFD